jgi:hypothetical protein
MFSNLERGITLVEIVAMVLIITIFSSILIADFPKIQRQFALSRATYKLAQDLRRAQDLGLSGVVTLNGSESKINVSGYGVFLDINAQPKKYVIYADVPPNASVDGDRKYIKDEPFVFCSEQTDPAKDCVIDIIDVSKENPNLYIKDILNVSNANYTSINFNPPSPHVRLDNLESGDSIGIVLGSIADPLAERTVWVNTSGLIRVQ